MPPFRLRSDTDPRVVEAHQVVEGGPIPPGVSVEASGLAAHTFDAYGRRVEVRPGDWVYPDRGGRGYVVSDDATFRRGWEPVAFDPLGLDQVAERLVKFTAAGPVSIDLPTHETITGSIPFPITAQPGPSPVVEGNVIVPPSDAPATREPPPLGTDPRTPPDAQGDHA